MKKFMNWKSIVVAIAAVFCIAGMVIAFTSKKAAVSTTAKTTESAANKGSTKQTDASSTTAASTTESLENQTPSTVYMTKDISPEGLQKVYEALGRKAEGSNVAVKLHTGESEKTYYLRPEFIKDFVQSINGTIVECNTAYGGNRINTAMSMQVAQDHGFTSIANVDIMDSEGSLSLPVTNGTHLKEDLVGSHLQNYDFVVMLSHFKGHTLGGFGGAIKNMAIGVASQEGKNWIHSGGKYTVKRWTTVQREFLESMAEAAKAVADYEGDHVLYINVMNNLSVDCDCAGAPEPPTMNDIGILASLDPVALDQACVDLVYAAPDGKDLIQRIESRKGIIQLEHAAAIGLGSRKYNLVSIDE